LCKLLPLEYAYFHVNTHCTKSKGVQAHYAQFKPHRGIHLRQYREPVINGAMAVLVQAKQAETEKRVSDLAAQLEALQHENEALHQQNLTLQSALVVRASAPAPAPTSAPDSPASTSGQVRGVARLTGCPGVHTCLLGCSCLW